METRPPAGPRSQAVRHSYATAALSAGVRVEVLSKRLGHADVGVTLKVYAHVLPGDDEDCGEPVVAGVHRRAEPDSL